MLQESGCKKGAIMKQVASLQYDVIFKKAFGHPDIFSAFARDILNIDIEVDHVEMEKEFDPPVGRVASKFDLYAEDEKNRVIVDIQHVRYADHYDRFLHYHCAALLDQVQNADNYRPNLRVFTIVVLTSGDKHKTAVSITDFDPKKPNGKPLGEIPHKIVYLCPKYVDENTPAQYQEWLRAIDDTLDEEIDENKYTHPQIKNVFTHIGKDLVTPQERARMFTQYSEHELRNSIKEKGWRGGMEEGWRSGMEEGWRGGMEEGWHGGMEKGRREEKERADIEKNQAVRKMLALGTLTVEQIAQVLDLDIAYITSFGD